MLDRAFVIFWILWGSIGIIVELFAIVRKAKGDTLSELIWQTMTYSTLIGYLLAAFLVWMLVHFLSGGKWA